MRASTERLGLKFRSLLTIPILALLPILSYGVGVLLIDLFSPPAASAAPAPAGGAAGRLACDLLQPSTHSDPASAAGRPLRAPSRVDTADFGFYEVREDGLHYAVRNGLWTFDHGAADPLEGWTSRDVTQNDRAFWRPMTEATWLAEGNPLPWPQLAGTGMALCGAGQLLADTLGWTGGIGYGNNWCQRLTSPEMLYDGSGDVELGFAYFNETEAEYDYSRVLVVAYSTTLLNEPGFNGRIGLDSLDVITPATYTRTITNDELGGGSSPRPFRIVLELRSDGGASDEDSYDDFNSVYGGWGVDDLSIDGANLSPPVTQAFHFETGMDGWTASYCPGVGSYLGIAPVEAYNILDPCQCGLDGMVMEFHDPNAQHPDGQHEMAISAIVDRRGDLGDPQYLDYTRILLEYDMYAEMPMENGVFYRIGWSYYPYENPNVPGLFTWSPRVGIPSFTYLGTDPVCFRTREIGTDWGLPATAEQIRAHVEVYSSCEAFGIDPCSGVTNPTPLLDNLVVRNVSGTFHPPISFATGGRFQDGYGQSAIGVVSPTDPGNANIVYNTRFGTSSPAKLGDSLSVVGPTPSSTTRWESRLWFRLKRTGPGQNSIAVYNTWKNAMMGKGIDFFTGPNPGFTWGYMDSVEVGTSAARNKFCSQFRDGPSSGGWNLPADLCFDWGGGGEQGEGNEILPDLCFTPGTLVEYFVTSNYTCTPGAYVYLPDTTGGRFEEFEILPRFRLADGQIKMPQVLYIDAYNRSRLDVVEEALNLTLYDQDLSTPLPDLAPWDRYDYQDASSSWRATFYRDYGGNSGAAMPQLLCYRMIVLSTGTLGTGTTVARDWQGLQQWLENPLCESNVNPQGLVLDGTDMGSLINSAYPAFLSQICGATSRCDAYHEEGCPPGEIDNDENTCVRLEPAPGSPLDPGVPIDLYGNWCPWMYPFDVLGTSGTGQGSKTYAKIGSGTQTEYAQVIRDALGQPGRYRTVLNGYSAYQLTARDLEVAPDPDLECPVDSASRVTAAAAELKKSIQWALNISYPEFLGVRQDPCNYGMDAPDPGGSTARVDALYPNRPNPFNPRTTIRYSLAADGPAKIEIFDVQGRRIRTLVDGARPAGPNEAIWDGADDEGRSVGAGVYWYRLSTTGYVSNRKMVVVK